MSDYWLEFKQQETAHKAFPVKLFPLKVTKASPPLPSHDASGTTLLSRKSQLSRGKRVTAGEGKHERKGETFGLLLFWDPNSFKRLKDQNAIIMMIPRQNYLRKYVIVEAVG